MTDGIQFKVGGLESVLEKLKEVKADVRYKGGRFAARKAALVLVEAAQANAQRLDDPETANEIAANITTRFSSRRFKRTGDIMFRVGVLGGARSRGKAALKSARRRQRQGTASLGQLGEIQGKGKGNPGGDTFYWRFLEFGTSRSRAQPFMRPAMNSSQSQVFNEFATQYDKALTRAIRRANKAAGKR